MLDYFNALGLDRNQSTDEIRKALISLRKKWVGRAQAASNSENLREAERQVEMIQDALLKFADDASRTSYEFELNNQTEEYSSVESDEPTDEIYKKNLASANALFEEHEFGNALALASNMLAEKDNRTARVYEIAMLSLFNMSRYDEALQMGVSAINEENREDTKIYRILCLSCEAKDNSSLAHRYLLQLKQTRPNDLNVDYLISEQFMNHFNGIFLVEAREYIDSLLKHISTDQLESSPEIAEWDIRYELIQGNTALVIPKMAPYFYGLKSDNARNYITKSFTDLLEKYIIQNFNSFDSYVKKIGFSEMASNVMVSQNIAIWDIMYSLASAENLEEQWYRLVSKYPQGSMSSASVTVMERFAKRVARQLPSINQSIQVGRRILTVDNSDDYEPLNKLLLTLKNLTAHLLGRSEKFDSLIKEISYLEDLDTAYYLKNERKRWRLFEIIAGVLLILLGAPLFLNVDTLSSFFRALGSKLTYSADPASAYLAVSMFIEMIIVITVIRLFSSFWGSSLSTGLKIFLGIIPLPTNITLYGVLGIIVPLGIYEMTYKTDLARTIDNNLKFLGSIYASTVSFINNIKVPAIIIFLIILVAYFVFVIKVIRRSRFIGKVKPIFGTVIFDWIEH